MHKFKSFLQTLKRDKELTIRNMRILEDQNASLKSKVDEVKAKLAHLSSSETELKDKLSSSNRSLKEHMSSSSNLQDELSRVRNYSTAECYSLTCHIYEC